MTNSESLEMRKEKLMRRLNSLSPQARMAILEAALEIKQETKQQDNQQTRLSQAKVAKITKITRPHKT